MKPATHDAGMTVSRPAVGVLLRDWRRRRRLSQLELSIRADISTRHLSFLETGRSSPSREMVLQLADRLDLALRERNRLLLAAGFAPVYSENALDAPPMTVIRSAIRQVLDGHEPYPAVVVDRSWNLVAANESLSVLTDLVAPRLLVPPANVLRASLHPNGLAPHIVNLGEWRSHLLHRLSRQVEFSGDPDLADLEEELRGYPGGETHASGPTANDIVVPVRLRRGGRVLNLFTTLATFGTPLDVTLSELSIESFYPADEETARELRTRRSDPS
ncbi:helix-turn-helix domain protein [Salinispora tropica CNB-440]|uniref:Helix-turn-helix domain protein n=1 Tax=Salinispora tropica (strain ATCC BAA-916 / DSM 44818 / JCM 13857 / NBRC 105044 / CNB-440) TaxID=369723 RepID=A4XD47_SALTO|nr:helix-turn-helix domain protein [Salinispora tropica CNB-440]